MKTWLLIPLVVFIAVAGYQFGYYHAKLESSEADKERVADVMEQQNRASDEAQNSSSLLAGNVIGSVAAAEAPPQPATSAPAAEASPTETMSQTQQTIDTVMSGGETRKQMRDEQSNWADNFDENEQDFEAATQLADFFTLHPQGESVYLHSIQCDGEQCHLIGQFEGTHQSFENIINEMKQQPWWEYSGTSSNTSSDGGLTHFVLHLTSERQS